MKFLRSLLLLVLAPTITGAAGLQVMIRGEVYTFKDVPENAWFATYVKQAVQSAIVSGYADARGKLLGFFGPSDDVTIAQALKIAVNGAGYDSHLYSSAHSRVSDHWAAQYFAVAAQENFLLVQPDLDLGLDVDRPATRAEVAAIFSSAFKVPLNDATGAQFTDVPADAAWASCIEALARDGILSGDQNLEGESTHHYRPSDPVNRAETVKIVMAARALYKVPGSGRVPASAAPASAAAETSASSSAAATGEEIVISFSGADFNPPAITIKAGQSIVFQNTSDTDLLLASDPHPTHEQYGPLNAPNMIGKGQSFTVSFPIAGQYGYHNHLNPTVHGIVVVQ